MTVPKMPGELVTYDKATGKHIYTGKKDNITYEFDLEKQGWFPRITEEMLNAQQQAYKLENTDETVPVESPSLKRKRQPRKKKVVERKNTGVYVTGLPLDAKVEEIGELFKKAGVLLEDPVKKLPRIKLYNGEDGIFKGDALVIYLREESVALACQLFDDTAFRFGSKTIIKVQPAVYAEKELPKVEEPKTDEELAEIKLKHKAIHEMHKKLDWDEGDEERKVNSKALKTVILKHMFNLEDIEKDPGEIIEIKQDVREECAKLGEVTSVNLFDLEEEGIVVVRFRTPEAATLCVQKMDGRAFDGRTVAASISSGSEKFKKTKRGNEEDDAKRQDEYGKWLESQDV